jgi:hypothetical protein
MTRDAFDLIGDGLPVKVSKGKKADRDIEAPVWKRKVGAFYSFKRKTVGIAVSRLGLPDHSSGSIEAGSRRNQACLEELPEHLSVSASDLEDRGWPVEISGDLLQT